MFFPNCETLWNKEPGYQTSNLGVPFPKGESPMKKNRMKEYALDAAAFVGGSVLFAVAIDTFSSPNAIAPGGATGLATIVNYLTTLPIGTTILLINLPLFLLGWKLLGWRFLARTVVATIVSSALIDGLAPFLPQYQGDTLLAALYGGFLSGLGLGLIYLRGATTGGSDLGAKLLSRKFPHIPMGKLIMAVDLVIVLAATLVYGTMESGLYALIMIFISSRLIDGVLYGADTGKMMLIVSDQNDAIAKRILEDIQRGVTVLKAQGAYTGEDKEVLLCVVRRQEVFQIRAVIKQTDPDAFIVVSDVGEIIGEGFKHIDKQ